MLSGVDDIPAYTQEYIYPGPQMFMKTTLANLDPTKFRVFKDGEAVSVLKEFVDHFFMKKFAGPWPS